MIYKILFFSTFALIGLRISAQNLEIYHATGYSEPEYTYDDAKKKLTIDFWVKNDGYNNSDATKIVAILINKDNDVDETIIDSYDLPGLSYSPNAGGNLHHVESWTISLGNKDLQNAEYKVKIHMNPDKTAHEQTYQDNAMTFGSSFDFSNAMGLGDNQLYVQNIKAFPNPATDKLFIEIRMEDMADLQLRLYDLPGKLLFTEEGTGSFQGIQTFHMDLQSLESGTYIYTLTSRGTLVSAEKFQVVR